MALNALKTDGFTESEFFPQNNGEISESITQNWTDQALECYKLNGDCSSCSISKGQYSFACQMPKVLDILIKLNGKPVIKSTSTSKLKVLKA